MSSQKKNTFYGAAAFLTMTTILVKIIGAIYKIPLTALLPDEAYGDFNAAYNIYTVFLTISTAGLPVALSKTVSECNALGLHNQKERVFRVALAAFLVMGTISFQMCIRDRMIDGQQITDVGVGQLHNALPFYGVESERDSG